jgi:hypothetical protein
MAGRRVRCKHCGTTFQLPPNPTSADPFEHQEGTAGVEGSSLGSVHGVLDEVQQQQSSPHTTYPEAAPPRPTPEIPPPFGDEAYDPDADVDSVFQDAFQEYTPARGNTPFVFPGSHALDQWLPLVLVIISLTWLGYQILNSLDKDPPWVGVVRMLVLLLAYTGIVFPLCLKGVRMAARKLNYDLPSGTPGRAFATFLLPVTIGCVVWLSSQSVPGFIFGTMMGLVVAMPVMWLLFRIRQDDAPVSLGYGAAAFGAAVLASAIVLVVLNLIVLGVVRGTKSQQTLAMSPFGPNFAWDVVEIVEKSPVKKSSVATNQRPKKNEPVAPTTKVAFSETPPPAADTTTRPSQVQQAGETPIAPATKTSEPTPPTNVAVGQPTLPGPTPPAKQTTGQPPAPPAATGSPANGSTTAPSAYGPIVAEAIERMSTDMTGLVQPLLAGHAVAVVRNGERQNEDVVELWDSADWKPQRSKTFVRPGSSFANYQLSSDGTLLARLTDFPFKAAQVYSFADNALLTPPIKLDPRAPTPYLAGYVAPGQLMMFFAGAGVQSSVEIWDVNKVRRIRKIDIPGLHSEAGSYAISQDGKLLAAVSRDESGPADAPGRLEVYNLLSGALTRRITIDELQWNSGIRPSGISFNDQATKIAVLFEHQGQGLFLCWGNANDIPIHQYVYPGGLIPQGANIAAFQGPSFGLVDNGNAWMIYGATVFDSATGLQLGDLKIKDVISQRVVSRDTLFLLQQSGGKTRLLEVRLDVGRARRVVAAKE